MGFFNRKPKFVPNYKTVPSKNGPVIDVFSLDGEGYNTVNASNADLFLSGMAYWNMEVKAYGCDYDIQVARNNSSRFFSRLWDNGYQAQQPLIGWYLALYTVFHGGGWSDISRQAMKVFCESVFKTNTLHTQEAWYLSMMYTSLCGGSFDDVVMWLHSLLESNVSQKRIPDGASLVMPVLKHYKTLQAIVKKVPFDTPQEGETLADYWDYIADKFMCEEAKLEAAFIRIFLAHSPYKSGYGVKDHYATGLNTRKRAKHMGISFEAPYFNEAAKKGNILALSVVDNSNWIYETFMNKLKYPKFNSMVLANDDYIRKNKDNIFQIIYSQAKARSEEITSVGIALKEAELHYATGLCHHIQGKDSYDEMKLATKDLLLVKNAKLPDDRINAAKRAAVWLYHLRKEECPYITKEDTDLLLRVEKLAINAHNNQSEIFTRRLGKLLKDGFMGMHPQPQLWNDFRFKAFDMAKSYGIAKYILDEDEYTARYLFDAVIKNEENKYNQNHITASWLGLAWLRYSNPSFSPEDLTEALEFISRDKILRDLIGEDAVKEYVAGAKKGKKEALTALATYYCTNKDVHKGDYLKKDMGKLFAYRITDMLKPHLETYSHEMKLEKIADMVKTEMEFAGYSPRLFDYIVFGLDNKHPYFYQLLANEDVYKGVYYEVSLEKMLLYLFHARSLNMDLEEKIEQVQKVQQKLQQERDEDETLAILARGADEAASRSRSFTPTKPDPWMQGPSLVDVIMDRRERATNEDGLTNEELFNSGKRSYLEHESDQEVRKFLKNPFGW